MNDTQPRALCSKCKDDDGRHGRFVSSSPPIYLPFFDLDGISKPVQRALVIGAHQTPAETAHQLVHTSIRSTSVPEHPL